MGAVPFRWAGVRHRLDQLIFRAQRRGATLGLISHPQKGFGEILRESSGIGE
jgi:hypothetical protein